jgi:hypothetical protein
MSVKSTLYRFSIVLMLLALVVMAMPRPVQAAAGASVEIVSVKADESVTIRVKGFPANLTLVARLDRSGNAGIDGIVVGEIKTGTGADFEATLKFPAELKGVSTISVRLESTTGGWYAYNWFTNKSSSVAGPTTPSTNPQTVSPAVKLYGLDAGKATFRVTGFPANVNFNVRIGPFFNFWKGGSDVVTINSGKGGTFDFTVTLPTGLKAGELTTIRMDSVGGSVHYVAYNAFKNEKFATVDPNPAGPVSVDTCQITAFSPALYSSFAKGYDFDASWTIKNTSSSDWTLGTVDYKYVSGTKLHKFADAYDLPALVKKGESIKVTLDMLAPLSVGTYTTNWALVSGGKTLCNLPLTITVK